MTYAENVTRLLNRERFNLGLHSENTKQEIANINKREKENIANINLAADILVGKPKENWEAGLKDTHPVGGVGLLPYMYGRQIGAERKEADEAFEADRKKHLEKLAVLEAQLKANKNLDTQMHIEKQNLLLNGAYYEDADRFTQLSPHGQTQYAKRKLELFKDSVELNAKNYLAKSEDLLNVNGHEYTPKSVTGVPLYPIALKEHALNVGLDKIMTQKGINVFSPEMLELAGVTGPDGAINKARDNIMSEFRKQHGIDSSYQTRIKAIQEFQNDGEYDFNRLLTIFAGTWDEQGNLLGYGKGFDEALKMLRKEMVYGKLKGDKGWKVLEKIGEQINPITGTPFSEANATRLEQFRLDVNADRNNAARADVAEHETRILESKDKFLDWTRKQAKADPNFTMSQQQYEIWSDYLLYDVGHTSLPNWFTNEYFKLTKDDKVEIDRIQKEIDAGLFDESSLLGVNHRVINHFTQPRGGNNTSKVSQYNEAGGGYLNNILKEGGEYNRKLTYIVRAASGQTTLSAKDMKWNPKLIDGMNAMQADFRTQYELYRSKNIPPSEAASLAYKDVQDRSGIMVDGQESPLKKELGDKWTGLPLQDSAYFNRPAIDRKAVLAEGKEIEDAYTWGLEEGTDGEVWNSKFFETTPIPGSKEHINSALEYFRGNTNGQVPYFWKQLARKFPKINALQLMKWQIRANYGPEMTNERILALNPQAINTVDTACEHPEVTELNRYLNYKSTTAGDAQAKCAVNEYRELIIDKEGHVTQGVNQAAAESEAILSAPRHHEADIPEDAEYDEESGSVTEFGSLSQIEADRYWTGNYKPGDTRTIRGETQTLQENGKWKSENDLIEDEVNQKGWVKKGGFGVYNVEERTVDIPENIINAYGGGFEGRAKYLAAKQRYEKDQNTPEYGFGLGVSSGIHGGGATRVENRAIPGKNFDELSLADHKKLDQTWWFESKIDPKWLEQFNPKTRNIIQKLEYKGEFNPEIHNYIPGSLKGEIFGVPWELPNVPGKGLIIPKEKVSNLQSMSSSPDSPYLDDSLRILSAQLLVASIGQEVPA